MLTLLHDWHDAAQSWVIFNAMFHPGRVLLLMIGIASLFALLVMLIPKGRRLTQRDRAQARDAAVQAAKKHLVAALQNQQAPKQADLDLINGEFANGGVVKPSPYLWTKEGQRVTPKDVISGLTKDELVAALHHKPGERACVEVTQATQHRRPSTGVLPTVANPAHPMHKSVAELNAADIKRASDESVRLVPRNAPTTSRFPLPHLRVGVRDPLGRLQADMVADASLRASTRSRIASANVEVLRMKAAFFAREAVRAHLHAQSEFVNAQEQQRLSDYYALRADRIEKFTAEDVA